MGGTTGGDGKGEALVTPAEWQLLGLGGIVAAFITAGLGYLGVKQGLKVRARELALQKETGDFSQSVELFKLVDERVAAALVEPLKRIEILERRERSMTDAVRRWYQRLVWWDDRGRPGKMPTPSHDELVLLSLADMAEDTLTRDQIADLTRPKES